MRRILRLDVYRDGGRRVVVTVESDAFCHSMVRSLVGALVAVGRGARIPNGPAACCGQAGATRRHGHAPQGLILESVAYPPDELVAERAEVTRAFRGAPEPTSG